MAHVPVPKTDQSMYILGELDLGPQTKPRCENSKKFGPIASAEGTKMQWSASENARHAGHVLYMNEILFFINYKEFLVAPGIVWCSNM